MTTPLRLLLIEDSADDELLIVRELRRGGYTLDYERVDTAEALRSALDREPWDVVLSDFSMPHFRGTDALRLLRQHDQDTPFIFVSGTIGEDVAVDAMRSGAQDYVIKSNLRRLVPAIERELRDAAMRRMRRTSEARFRRVVDSAMIGILFWDAQGRITEANDQFLTMVGYTREDLQGGILRHRVMTPPEYDAIDAKALQECATRGICVPYEKEYIRKDGARVPVIVGRATLDEPDLSGVAFVVDITARKEAERALHATRVHLERMLASSAAIIYSLRVVGDDLVPEWLSENVTRITGYPLAEASAPTWWASCLHPDDQARVLGEMPRLFRQGSLITEYRFRFKDGTYRWVRDEARLLHDPTGAPYEVVGAWVDITERRSAEEALRARERQQAAVATLGERAIEAADLKTLFDAAASLGSETLEVPYCAVLELAPDGGSLQLRAGVGWREGSVGATTVEATGESQAGYTLERHEPIIVEDLGTDPRFQDTSFLREHGVVAGVTVAIPSKNRVFGVLGIHADRPRKFTRDDIHFLQAVAHILGTAIDRERAETASRQSQRLESVGRLAGGVAHDFNNLLTAITGYSELLLTGLEAGNEMQEDIEEIRKAALRAASLTRQLLAFSRRQVLEPIPLNLNEILEDIKNMLHRLIGADIELKTVLRPDLGIVRADPGQIEQVIVNLVVNARDAMPTGGKLTLETANVELDGSYVGQHVAVVPGPYVMLAVTDTGSGMDKQTQARIFEPFFTTKGPERGTGLGLSTVYGIVKQSGGNIWVYSEPGHGTAFKIYLPLAVDKTVVARPVGRVSGSFRGSETVLLAEDEDSVRRLAERLLRQAGYEVLVAQNGEEALLLSQQYRGTIHLLISDVVMPHMGGGQLAGRLAATRSATRVLYLSGYTDPSIVQQGLLEGAAAFLQKPFTTDALLRKVRDVLDTRK
jgi:PAS domain S-box-containing protein